MGVHLENEMKRQKRERIRKENEAAGKDNQEDELDRLLRSIEEEEEGDPM
jgi:hypothetical protein